MGNSLITPDNTNTLLISNLLIHFGYFNDAMKKHLEQLQEQDATINLQDDYFPFEFNTIDALLDDFDKLYSVDPQYREYFETEENNT